MCEYSQYDQVNSSRTYCLSDNMALRFRHARSSEQIVEEDIQLRVKSPSLQQKQEIRNKALTAIESLTADTCIEFAVKENKLYELVIRSIDNKVSYAYRVDGKDILFDKHAQQWFAKYVPMIANSVSADQ